MEGNSKKPDGSQILKASKDPLFISILRKTTPDFRQYLHTTVLEDNTATKTRESVLTAGKKGGPCRTDEICCRDVELGTTKSGSNFQLLKTGCGKVLKVSTENTEVKPWSVAARDLLDQSESRQKLNLNIALADQSERKHEDNLSEVPENKDSTISLVDKLRAELAVQSSVLQTTDSDSLDASCSKHIGVYEICESGLKSSTSVDISKKILAKVNENVVDTQDSKDMPCRTEDCCRFEGQVNPNFHPEMEITEAETYAIGNKHLRRKSRDFQPIIEHSSGPKKNVNEGDVERTTKRTKNAEHGRPVIGGGGDVARISHNKDKKKQDTVREISGGGKFALEGYEPSAKSNAREMSTVTSFGENNRQEAYRQSLSARDPIPQRDLSLEKSRPKRSSSVRLRKTSSVLPSEKLLNPTELDTEKDSFKRLRVTQEQGPGRRVANEESSTNDLDGNDLVQGFHKNATRDIVRPANDNQNPEFGRGILEENFSSEDFNENKSLLGFYKNTTRDILYPTNVVQESRLESPKKKSDNAVRKLSIKEEMAELIDEADDDIIDMIDNPEVSESIISRTEAKVLGVHDSFPRDQSLTSFLAENFSKEELYPYDPLRRKLPEHELSEEFLPNDTMLHVDVSAQCVSPLYPAGSGEARVDVCKYACVKKLDAETQFEKGSVTTSDSCSNLSNYSSYRALLRDEVQDLNVASRKYRKLAAILMIINLFLLLGVMGACAYVVLQYMELEKILQESQEIVKTCENKYGGS